MAAASTITDLISIEQYLNSTYEPDLEFVDGVLEEKNRGEYEHGFLQGMIATWFNNHRAEWKIKVSLEYRTRTSTSRVRLPDVCVLQKGMPVEKVRITAPLLCIEILSSEDRPGRVMKRLDEFVKMGAENVWILDPGDRSAATYSRFGMKPLQGDRLTIPDSPIYLDVPSTFATLDEEQ